MPQEAHDPKNTRVIVLDDDPSIRRLVSVNLEKRGYRVTTAEDGDEAIGYMQDKLPDLALIDLLLPGISGIEVCQWIRQRSNIPIIVLSAHSQEDTKVEALDYGADDYITKPFGTEEMLARIRAVMRRANDVPISEGDKIRVELPSMTINLKQRRVTVENVDVKLTRTEFALLAELAQNLDAILSHDELLARVWGPEYRGSSHYLHVYLGRIRSKIGPKSSNLLETVPGFGYVLHSSVPSESV